jgi:predicted membrane channel-forming protein YqfA (hemolysin III family)
MFCLHNETLNAWTMIANGIISMYLYSCSNKNVDDFIFMLSCIVHAPVAFAYHTLMPQSQVVRKKWLARDNRAVMVTSFLLSISLARDIREKFVLGSLSAVVLIASPNAASFRKTDIVAPMLMSIFIYCTPLVIHFNKYSAGVLGSLLTGLVLYATDFPEVVFDKMDLYLPSHALMHICLIMAHVFGFFFRKN